MTLRIEPTSDIDACHAIRREVFIVEQGIAESEEWDDLDADAIHLLAWLDGQPVGTARLVVNGSTGRIGRICVRSLARGRGVGAALVSEGVSLLSANVDLSVISLGAQTYAIPFYEKLGFSGIGPEYDDAGIPHREMELCL